MRIGTNSYHYYYCCYVIVQRSCDLCFLLFSEPYHDIRYNLMAVVADGMMICEERLKKLTAER